MNDQCFGECCAALCGGCSLFLTSSLGAWCNQLPFGTNGCCRDNNNRGCCGSCCRASFDEDNFEKQILKDMARAQAAGGPVTKQPTGGQEMSIPQTAPANPHPKIDT